MENNSLFHLKIITPDGIFFDDKVLSVVVKTPVGEAGILKNHVPFVSTVEVSLLTIREVNKTRQAAISGGIIYVERDHSSIITDNITYVENINISAEEKNLTRIKSEIANKKDKKSGYNLDSQLTQTLNRINIKNKSKD